VKAGGYWPEVRVVDNELEQRLARERAARIEAHKRHEQRVKRSKKLKQHKKVKQFTKARKNAVLLITRALRT
jgi:hypothetical protein